ncbi:glycoside hydrolase, superfamily [Rhodotorula toruloides]|uniref:Glycoside hydrolase, superfamily n=1 Tax=Rhodotorula toruloides TaxID=5286 RepID=A0A511KLE2_RHOTO|nr:glycoside hydrolase, superfamily [Rhodotorula toruloides]
MHYTTVASILTFLSATTAVAAPSRLDTLEKEHSHAAHEASKAAALIARAKTYGNSPEAKYKREVFADREKRWVKEEKRLEQEIQKRASTISRVVGGHRTKTTAAPTKAVSRVLFKDRTSNTSTSKWTTTTAPASTSTASFKSKKGVGYNTASYTSNLKISWAYNWGQTPDGTLNKGVEYVPMYWGPGGASTWSANAQKAIASGSTHLLGMNEPDLGSQSNLTIPQAVANWKANMSPFYGKAKLVSPAVTNGGYPMGVGYLQDFRGNCTQCWNEIDAVALHWYDVSTNLEYFMNYLTDAYKTLGKPIWLTEFAGSGTSSQQQQFLETYIPWMDAQPWIQRYAGFGDFAGNYVNSDGSLTPLGQTYSDTV